MRSPFALRSSADAQRALGWGDGRARARRNDHGPRDRCEPGRVTWRTRGIAAYGESAVSNGHGDFTIADIVPGKYTLTVSYVGFETFSTDMNVTGEAGERGEVEAINIERTADNIIQVLRPWVNGTAVGGRCILF